MTDSDRTYSWDDEARVIVSPREPNIPRFHADLGRLCAPRAEGCGGSGRGDHRCD